MSKKKDIELIDAQRTVSCILKLKSKTDEVNQKLMEGLKKSIQENQQLKQQLAEKDKEIESLKNQLEKEANDNLDWEGKCLCLYSMLYETLEKLDPAPNDIASAIQQMTNENFDKQNEQFKSIQSCGELVKQLVEKDKEIERLKQCVMSREQVEAIATQTMREQMPIIDKECRHRICEEIRDKSIFADHYKDMEGNIYWVERYLIDKDDLDQIEKGEK